MNRNPMYVLILAAALPLGLTQFAHAQSVGQELGQALHQFLNPQNESASEEELRSFNFFMQNHPEIAQDLKQRPDRVNDRGYLEHHPELQEWLNRHPGAASAFTNNPGQFMAEEQRFEDYNRDFQSGDEHRGEMAHFDWFLDSHPEVRSDLMRRPELASRDWYLDKHPQLREFLNRHPLVSEQLRDNPRGFMDREARFANHDYNRESVR